MDDILIAAVIFNSKLTEKENALCRIEKFAEDAGKENVKIVCFPELSVSGYTAKTSMADIAETLPGPSSRRLSKISKKTGVTILAGLAEKSVSGKIYASHLVAAPDGSLGVYRKLHLAPPETFLWHGDRITIFEACGLKFGIQLCYDTHFPELSTTMALEGVDIIFMPHASPRGNSTTKLNSWMRHLSARAFDNATFIVACNQVGKNGSGLSFPGVAAALGPDGNLMESRFSDKDEMMIVEIKKKALARVREHRMRYFLPNRRPEIYGAVSKPKQL